MVSLCPDVKPETSVVSLLQGNVVKSPQRTFLIGQTHRLVLLSFRKLKLFFNYFSTTGAQRRCRSYSQKCREEKRRFVSRGREQFPFFPLRSSKIGADKSGRCLEAQEDERTSICLAELAADVLELNNGSRGTDRLLVERQEEEEKE